jgi:tetrapyrrole methylase family protein/MazG family protein
MDALLALVEALRDKNGCPWDKKQTPRSMAAYMTEELYELLEAIEENRPEEICAELGDLLFHICFITRLFQEQGAFDIHDVISATLTKMVHRHPHVFGEKNIGTADAVKDQWHRIKQKENGHARKTSVVESVPAGTPALLRAYRISDRVARTGFDWQNISDVFKKVEEEIAELKSAITSGVTDDERREEISLEFGDVLFALVNIARFAAIQPESALAASIRKFSRRFKQLEQMVSKNGKSIEFLSPEEMHQFWELAKEKVG